MNDNQFAAAQIHGSVAVEVIERSKVTEFPLGIHKCYVNDPLGASFLENLPDTKQVGGLQHSLFGSHGPYGKSRCQLDCKAGIVKYSSSSAWSSRRFLANHASIPSRRPSV